MTVRRVPFFLHSFSTLCFVLPRHNDNKRFAAVSSLFVLFFLGLPRHNYSSLSHHSHRPLFRFLFILFVCDFRPHFFQFAVPPTSSDDARRYQENKGKKWNQRRTKAPHEGGDPLEWRPVVRAEQHPKSSPQRRGKRVLINLIRGGVTKGKNRACFFLVVIVKILRRMCLCLFLLLLLCECYVLSFLSHARIRHPVIVTWCICTIRASYCVF